MFGDDTINAAQGDLNKTIYKTITIKPTSNIETLSADTVKDYFEKVLKVKGITYSNPVAYDAVTGATVTSLTKDTLYFVSAQIGGGAVVGRIEINPDTFPGAMYVQGDTYGRSEITGEDELFVFIINKAKIVSEATITMEAEGKTRGLPSINLANCWKPLKAA